MRQLRTREQRLRDAGLLTLTEIAALLSVSTGTVKAWHHAGLIAGHPYDDKGQCLYPPPGPNPRPAHKDASSASEPLSSPPPPAAHEPAGLSDPTATVSTSNNTRTRLTDRDCNFNGVTPETEETPVTDVTTGRDRTERSSRRPMSSCCGSLPSGPAPAG